MVTISRIVFLAVCVCAFSAFANDNDLVMKVAYEASGNTIPEEVYKVMLFVECRSKSRGTHPRFMGYGPGEVHLKWKSHDSLVVVHHGKPVSLQTQELRVPKGSTCKANVVGTRVPIPNREIRVAWWAASYSGVAPLITGKLTYSFQDHNGTSLKEVGTAPNGQGGFDWVWEI